MAYKIAQIHDWLAADWLNCADANADIEHLAFDSRRVSQAERTLFFALSGQRDGHDFVAAAYGRGVRNFVVSSERIDFQQFSDANFLKVPDVLRGLQIVGRRHREQFPNVKIIGITGSNGKTTVKEWLFQLLKDDYNVARSPKSFNSQIGVPMSIWQIQAEHNLAIIEVGVSEVGEMAASAWVVRPLDIGILTNIGAAHDGGFPNRAAKLQEKLSLFDDATLVIANADVLEKYPSVSQPRRLKTWSHTQVADLQIVENQQLAGKTILKAIYKNESIPLSIEVNFSDKAALDNAATCWLTLLEMGFPNDIIAQRMRRLEAVEMRLELKSGINGCTVVNDAYSNDLTSLEIALDFVKNHVAHRRRTLVLSDILESGQSVENLYSTVAEMVSARGVSRVVGVGRDVLFLKKYLPQSIDFHHFETTDAFLKTLHDDDFRNEAILLKGARIFQFERVAERLSEKSHKTVLEINLDALAHNFAVFQKILRGAVRHELPERKVKTMAMVKASAYGNGSDEVARLLAQRGADYLAVAYADEGVALRRADIRLPIMVMNPEESSFDALRRYALEPEIYSIRLLEKFADYSALSLEPQAASTADRLQPEVQKIHLKLDTGMHRLGFESIDIERLIFILKQNKQIQIASIFTHLAGSEAAAHDDFTHQQVALFSKMYAEITEGLALKNADLPMRHVLNSSGIVRFSDYHFEMVRLGIGLYGIESSAEIQPQLDVVQTLKAAISQIRTVAAGETVGYARRGVLQRTSRIATISLGYADGLARAAGNGAFSVWLHGKRAPIVGGICMDMTMIDVTDIAAATEGDSVEIFGAHVGVQELAAAVGTIPYEIFTGISERVKRVYFQL